MWKIHPNLTIHIWWKPDEGVTKLKDNPQNLPDMSIDCKAKGTIVYCHSYKINFDYPS